MNNQTHNNIQNTGTQKRWKLPLIVSGIILCIWYLASVILTSEESSTPNTSVISVNTGVYSQSGSVITKNEITHTLSASGTKELPPCITVNPFSGATDCKKEEKPKFHKPNTEWKTRTLNINGQWLTYEFGKGNPASVDLKESDLKPCSFQEGGDYCTDSGAGYVDSELEKALIDLFNLPNWNQIITNCQQQFLDTDIIQENRKRNQPELEYPLNFWILQNLSSYVSMEDIIVINPETGRKNISRAGYQKLMNILGYIGSATWYDHNRDTIEPSYSKCVDTYGAPIINSLINIRSMPWR